jgi:hypothetical protein
VVTRYAALRVPLGSRQLNSKVFGAVAGLALPVVAGAPAHSQFMSSYPVVIVIPPPAQNLVMPKPAPKPNKSSTSAPPSAASPPDLSQCYQGKTRVCQ